jgi:hypothetical protein
VYNTVVPVTRKVILYHRIHCTQVYAHKSRSFAAVNRRLVEDSNLEVFLPSYKFLGTLCYSFNAFRFLGRLVVGSPFRSVICLLQYYKKGARRITIKHKTFVSNKS